MTNRTAKTFGLAGIAASACATLLAIFELAGLRTGVEPAQQGALFAVLIGVAITSIGIAAIHATYAEADARSVSQVNTAFKAGVDYGLLRRRRPTAINTSTSFDDAA